jgi:hypothetical protein
MKSGAVTFLRGAENFSYVLFVPFCGNFLFEA